MLPWMTDGTRDLLDEIRALVAEVGKPADLDVMTGSVAPKHAAALAAMRARGELRHLRLVVDSGFLAKRDSVGQPAHAAVDAAVGRESVRAIRTHAKAVRVAGPGGAAALLCSANLNANRSVEFYERADHLAPVLRTVVDGIFDGVEPGCEGQTQAESGLALRDVVHRFQDAGFYTYDSSAPLPRHVIQGDHDDLMVLRKGSLGGCIPAALARVGQPATLWASGINIEIDQVHHLARAVETGTVSDLRIYLPPELGTRKGSRHTHAAVCELVGDGLRWADTHAKLLLVKGPLGTVAFTGSANLAGTGALELVRVSTDPALHAHLAGLLGAVPEVMAPPEPDLESRRRARERYGRRGSAPRACPAGSLLLPDSALQVAPGYAPRRAALPLSTATLRVERARLRMLADLSLFVRWAWPILNPGTSLIWGRHLDLICRQLEAVTQGRSGRFTVINIPPGHCKTTIISVCWPVWEWLHQPQNRWIFATNARDLATRDNEARRDLIKDPRFQALFRPEAGGHAPSWETATPPETIKARPRRPGWSLSRGKDQKTRFSNSLRGSMMALSVGSRVTGNHGDRLVIDDPLDAGDIYGPQLAGHVAWYRDKLSTRVRDGARIVLVMQRLHQDDLAGVLLARAREDGTLGQPGGTDLLCFPALYDPDDEERHSCTAIGARDWRKVKGEVLWPERFPRPALDAIEAEMTPGAWACQYLQLTVVLEGMLLRPEWWQRYDVLPQVGRWCMTIDPTTGSQTVHADWTVAQVWLLAPPHAYLVEEIRGQWTSPEALEHIEAMIGRYPALQEILVEHKAHGKLWQQHLEAKGVRHIKGVDPQGIPKPARIDTAGGVLKAGRLHIPARADWDVEAFVDECQRYPKGKDDRPDCMAQFVCEHLDQLWGGRRRPSPARAADVMPSRAEVHKRGAGHRPAGGHKKATKRSHVW